MPRIEGIALYEIVGSREAVVAPNAYVGIRPPHARENLLLLLSDDGRCGITNLVDGPGEGVELDAGWMVGLDPREAFAWQGGHVTARAPAHEGALRATPGLDIALLDLCAQSESVPLWRLLGDGARPNAPAYDSTLYFDDLVDGDGGVDPVVRRAGAALARGHRALKIKVGRGLRWMSWPECTERDIAVCLAVRRAVGPEVTLMVDANHGYGRYVDDAVDFLTETADCAFAFAEEMVDDGEVAALRAALRTRGLEVPLAGGEEARGLAWCREQWSACPLDIFQMDMCRTGFLEYLAIAEFARDNGLRLAPHNFGTRIGVCAAAHLARAVPQAVWCECDDSAFPQYDSSGATLRDGALWLDERPGLGILASDPRVAPGSDEAPSAAGQNGTALRGGA